MKCLTQCIAALFLILLTACSSSGKLQAPASDDPIAILGSQIDAVLADSVMSQSNAGIKIVSLKTGQTLYQRNNNKLFHPASNMKVLTTSTALSVLGPTFAFHTDLLADSSAIEEKSINGNLYLRGKGDPDLLSEDLRKLAKELRLSGITSISGDVICDATYLDDLFWGRGWMWDDASAWYWAPISALNVNDNCVELTVEPGENVGDPLKTRFEPNTSFMQIVNDGMTVPGSDSVAIDSFEVLRRWKKPANIIDVSGGRTASHSSRTWTIDVIDAPLYVGTLLKEILAEEGIVVNGTVVEGKTGISARLLARHTSETLATSIVNTNKVSDNLSAELLLKIVGAEARGTPGTAQKGISEIYRFLDELGVDSTSYYLADGSGVSRYNTITPDLMISLLQAMHSDTRIQAEFKASLPIAGKDGTLGRRMRDSAAEGNLRAKTGSLRGVSSISGYTTTADGEELMFSILMEHFVVGASKIRNVQDKIGALMSDFSRKMPKR